MSNGGTRVRRRGLGLVAALGIGAVLFSWGPASGAATRAPAARALAARPAAPIPDPPGTTERASVASNETQGNGDSGGVSALPGGRGNQALSADGRWVAFVSDASNLVPNDVNGSTDLFLRDRQLGTTIQIPWLAGEPKPSGVIVAEPSISADGDVVAFTAYVADSRQGAVLLPETRALPYVLYWVRSTNVTDYASLGAKGEPVPGWQPSVSADGQSIAYAGWLTATAPTPSPTPTPIATPTPTPDTTPPTMWGLSAYPLEIKVGCPTTSSTVTAYAFDASGVNPVTLYYWPPASSTTIRLRYVTLPRSVAMVHTGTNQWVGTINGVSSWNEGTVDYYVRAWDTPGNSTTLWPSESSTITAKAYACLY